MEHRAQFANLMQYTLELLFLKQQVEKGQCDVPEDTMADVFEQSEKDCTDARIEMARLMGGHELLSPREVLKDAQDAFKQEHEEQAIRDIADMVAAGMQRDYDAVTARPPKSLKERIKTYATIAAILALVGGYFGTRAYAAVNVTHAVETSEGLTERVDAWNKAVRYDDWASTRVRRGGWLKGILFWPIEPSDEEMGYASEFANVAIGAVHEVNEMGLACGTPASYDATSFSDDEIAYISDLAQWLPGELAAGNYDNPFRAVGEYAVSRYPCQAG